MFRCVLGVILATVLVSICAAPVAAQTPTPNQINAVAKELWCPLCNGVRLDNCELQACVQMREVIAQGLEQGQSKEQIKAYFVQQYGDVVLGAPENRGFGWVVWLVPWLLALVGLGWLVYFVRAWSRRRPALRRAGTPQSDTKSDEYLARVNDELRKYND